MLWDTLWRNRIILSLGFCLSFSLLCIFWQRNPLSQRIDYIGHFADRVSGFINSSLSYTGTLWVALDEYRNLEERYNKAQKLLESYRLEKDKFSFLKRQNQNLRKALAFQASSAYPEVRAEVLGVRLNSISPRIIIAKGEEHGIRSFMPVITRTHDHRNNLIRSVVGITVFTKGDTALVQPLIHPSFELGVRIEHSQEWAILSGNSGRTNEVLLTYITSDFSPKQAILTQSTIPLIKNAVVNTSGAGGIFPPGIPIGVVSGTGRRKYDFQTAYVLPFVRISELSYVSVIIKKVEKWARVWKEDLGWQEHLKTEFGEPLYPKIKESEFKPKAQKQRKDSNPRSAKASIEKEEKEKRKGQESKRSREPVRRLQNLKPPNPQARKRP